MKALFLFTALWLVVALSIVADIKILMEADAITTVYTSLAEKSIVQDSYMDEPLLRLFSYEDCKWLSKTELECESEIAQFVD